ncbi:MAG: hypothetical protein NZ602_16065 [Thermoguttaceae bacterium]|nr:hypothetical protein [Thermoguttaceae bacterium]MDW8038058.1 hypothetical protein [Thermoguttaceae bacterium]
MQDPVEKTLEIFWAVMIFASIAWYFFLLFYVGVKGGWEIRSMGRHFEESLKDSPPNS